MQMTKIMGIHLVPLNEPLERRLQTLAALAQVIAMVFGGLITYTFALYVTFCTRFWWLPVAYLWFGWLDRRKASLGLRSSQWVRRWAWWRYFRDYFPLTLVKTAELDPSKNYLLCSFPHGVLSTGVSGTCATEACEVSKVFPGITQHVVTLVVNFFPPFIREMVMGMGFCSSTPETLNYLLDPANGTGRSVVLVVGGASEALLTKPGTHRILLRRRKGFVKLALRHGTSLVPVYSFGENELFDQFIPPEDSWLRSWQKAVQKYTGLVPVLMRGRGLFQYSCGIIPQSRPVFVVVGKPMDVERVPNPTQEQIDDLHTRFQEQLVALFEEHKYHYLENPEKATLEMV